MTGNERYIDVMVSNYLRVSVFGDHEFCHAQISAIIWLALSVFQTGR